MPKTTAKPKIQYICDNCGAAYPRWQGQCTQCGEWNTLVETVSARSVSGSIGSTAATMYGDGGGEVVSAAEVLQTHSQQASRLQTGLFELDRVFGGGIVFGSVSLVGGEPGIGKSTIITQMLIKILSEKNNIDAMYVAGEESPQQISQRIQRMIPGDDKKKSSGEDWREHLHFFTGTNVDTLIAKIQEKPPQILVVDSIQTMVTLDLTGMSGSVGQLREVTARLVAIAKQKNIPTFLIGHVTKEGDIAGPKVLEHIVDTVIHISGDRTGEVRIIRALKNRFGPTDEVGLFRLTSQGAEEVTNPAEIFLEESTIGKSGAALALCMEGSRPVVVEVQALVVHSFLPSPRRVSRGINVSKLHLLLAVLQKYTKKDFSTDDVYVNVVGMMQLSDPAVDLAVAMAILSSKSNTPPGKNSVYCGEIGLLGEVRRVAQLNKRVEEAKRLGYTEIYSANNIQNVRQLSK